MIPNHYPRLHRMGAIELDVSCECSGVRQLTDRYEREIVPSCMSTDCLAGYCLSATFAYTHVEADLSGK